MQALILNPNASRLARDPELVVRLTESAASRARVFVTQSLAELDRVAAALAAEGVQRVVLCGGDGTYMQGVSALARVGLLEERSERPLGLAFLAAGTVATVARAFAQPRELFDGLEQALAAEASFTPQPSLKVVSARGAQSLEQRVGFMFGTGLVARFFQRYYREGGGGLSAAAQIVARTFAGSFREDEYASSVLRPLPCRIAVDSGPLPEEAFSLVLCSVIRDVGLGMQVCYRAGEDWRRPHLVASSLPPRRLGPQVHRVLRGLPLKGSGNFDGLTSQVLVQFPGGDGPWVLDGDLFEAERIQVHAGPTLWLLAAQRRT